MRSKSLADLILLMLSPRGQVSQGSLDRLSPEDWQELQTACDGQRIGPLLYWQLKTRKPHLRLPEGIAGYLEAAFRRSAVLNLQVQHELLEIDDVLRKHSVPYVALKGAFLAFFAYPNPALRPLRDLDILVPRDKAMEAFGALVEGGAQRIEEYALNAASMIELSHQLPPVMLRAGAFPIELHTRLFHAQSLAARELDPSCQEDFWSSVEVRNLGNREIAFEPIEYQLLHLIVHSVYDHCFDNGPLLLSDIGFLMERHHIDWDLFWAIAKRSNHESGATLVFEMVQRYWDEQILVRYLKPNCTRTVPPNILCSTAEMMFVDLARSKGARRTRGREKRNRSLGQMRSFLQVLFPSRNIIVRRYAVDPASFLAFFYYPLYIWKDVLVPLASRRNSSVKGDFALEIANVRALTDWLAD